MKTSIGLAALTVTVGTMIMTAQPALAATTLPPVQRAGSVEYSSGGVGLDQSTAFERATKQWPLTLEFAIKDRQRADFAANVGVVVRDANGHTELQTVSSGPFLLARLTPGHYTVDATLDGKTLHEHVVISHGRPAKAVIVWPTGTDEGRS
jgi:hypothetical protein